MPRERDYNRKMFHRGHYEVIAARFREEASVYAMTPIDIDGDVVELDTRAAQALRTLRNLAESLSERFAYDNEEHDKNIFLERCGFIV